MLLVPFDELPRDFVLTICRGQDFPQIFTREHLEQSLDELRDVAWERDPAELLKGDVTAIHVLKVVVNSNLKVNGSPKVARPVMDDLLVALVGVREHIRHNLADLLRDCLQRLIPCLRRFRGR